MLSLGRTAQPHGLARIFTQTMATGFRDIFDFSRIAAPRLGSQVLAAANLAATWTNCAFLAVP